ncbi:MAG TPA: protein kinase, partial [Vicinamibacterales bacterium]
LAKALDQEQGSGDAAAALSNSPTITSPAMTMRGVILGTAAYMAPEQAKGRVIDKRADIWAFGCVVYEMLTGRRAFAGDDVSDTLASILKSDPDWNGVPPRAARLLKKCLEKDPRRRLHDIGDAWDLLEEPSTAPAPPARTPWLPWSLAALFAITTIGMVSMQFMAATPASAPMTRFHLPPPLNVELGTYVSLSRDGRRLAFTAADNERNTGLWVRDLESLDARLLPGTQNATSPFWSPDGQFIAFADGRTLKKVNIAGGPPQKIADAPTTLGMGAWNRDGVIVDGTRGAGPLYRVAANGGAPVPITALNESGRERGHSFPVFLPDEKRFLYLKLTGQQETQGIYVGSIDSSPEQQDRQRLLQLAVGPLALVQSSSGWHLFFVRDTTLMSQPFEPTRPQLLADAQPIAERIATAGSFAFFGATDDVLVYRTGNVANLTNEQLTWYSRNGTVTGRIGGGLPIAGGPASVSIAPDGRRAALMITSPQFTSDLWVVEFERGLLSRLTFTDEGEIAPVWAPDSRRLAYRTGIGANASFTIMVKDVDGTAEAAPPVKKTFPGIPTSWSPDGRFILFTRGPDAGTFDLFALSLERDVDAELVKTPFGEGAARLSPDNRWMAYQSNESGQAEIYVRPFIVSADGTPTVGPKSRVSPSGGVGPRWRSDGKELLYRSLTGDFMAAALQTTGDSVAISLPRLLFANVAGVRGWDATPDAQRFLLSVPISGSGATPADPMTVILNWRSMLK